MSAENADKTEEVINEKGNRVPTPVLKNQSVDVTVKNVDIYYGKHKAVEGVNLAFKKNEISALIGPSGCGKSTLLRSLNRMHEVIPNAYVNGEVFVGDVNIYGKDVDATRIRKRTGMLFQKPNPFPSLSIWENVVSGLAVEGMNNKKQMLEIAEHNLKRAFLWDEVHDKLYQPGVSLSGGQQQRLCIARTVACEPEIILMDEPCSALDPISTLKIEELMLELVKHFTIIIVTHNMQQAARVSNKTAFMLAGAERTGHLVEFDDTKKIFTSPKDQRTEDYISGKFG